MAKNKIAIPEPRSDQKITFSFEFYDTNSCKYCLSKWEQLKISETLKRLKEVNEKTIKELFSGRQVYHFHSVNWSQTTEKEGFQDKRVDELEPYQFSLIGVNNQKARVFGAFSKGVFYIVWFDLEHEIWPTSLKFT